MPADPFSNDDEAVLARFARHEVGEADDLLMPDAARLSEEVRFGAAALLRDAVDGTESALRRQAAAALASVDAEAAGALSVPPGGAFEMLKRADLLRADGLAAEFVAAAREQRLRRRLADAPGTVDPAGPILGAADPLGPLLAAEEHAQDDAPLSARARGLLVWRVAAAVRAGGRPMSNTDAALVAAATELVRQTNKGPRVAAVRLLSMPGVAGMETGSLLIEALRIRSVSLFAVVLARAAMLDYALARMLVLHATEPRFWAALRTGGVSRQGAGAVAGMLVTADPALDGDAAAEGLDWAYGLDEARLERAMMPLRLPADLRDALLALERR